MGEERAIMKKWKMHVWGFGILVLVQCMAIPLVVIFLREFAEVKYLRFVIPVIVLAACIAADIYYLFNKVLVLRSLLNQEPVKCKVEDILYIKYKDHDQDGGMKVRYSPYLIVRSMEDQELYLAYDKYSLVEFKTVSTTSGSGSISSTIYKESGKPLRLFDMVDMYLLKELDIPVAINRAKNMVSLKGWKINFNHLNGNMDIGVFKEIHFFKGAIDVDAYP